MLQTKMHMIDIVKHNMIDVIVGASINHLQLQLRIFQNYDLVISYGFIYYICEFIAVSTCLK